MSHSSLFTGGDVNLIFLLYILDDSDSIKKKLTKKKTNKKQLAARYSKNLISDRSDRK